MCPSISFRRSGSTRTSSRTKFEVIPTIKMPNGINLLPQMVSKQFWFFYKTKTQGKLRKVYWVRWVWRWWAYQASKTNQKWSTPKRVTHYFMWWAVSGSNRGPSFHELNIRVQRQAPADCWRNRVSFRKWNKSWRRWKLLEKVEAWIVDVNREKT